ncbi:MAG TPA: hypothetical protein VJ806_07560 [Luteimonas sp.]|nr:hypothetical protein [Luteimonas sp.]
MDAIAQRLDACERANRRFKRILLLQTAVLAALVSIVAARYAQASAEDKPAVASLRVAELIVVDGNGVERVRVGGDLPDAVIDGKRVPRGSKAAGVMLYDRTGQERGGYVTWDEGDNIGLTLDGRKGQNALFVAGPDGSTSLQMWQGQDMMDLRVDDSGARITRTQAGAVTFQQPAVAAIGTPTCMDFRNGLRSEVPEGLSADQIRKICLKRFTTDACQTCLAPKQ